jgi:hypothetical protein
MAELKRVFSKAIMNKDMDERLVPNGQHRDALNIQIATSDGSDVGSVQTLKGNALKAGMSSSSGVYGVSTQSSCVGSIGSADKDKIYYFVDDSSHNDGVGYQDIQKDYILEFDVITNKHKYVFVDIHNVKVTIAEASTDAQAFLYIPNLSSSTINKTGVRIGMSVTGTLGDESYTVADGITVSDLIYNGGNASWKIIMEKDGVVFQPLSGVDATDVINFVSPRVLNFSKNIIITGINILDDFIYWTDNTTEPKKVNIPRSIAGTGGTEYLRSGGIAGYALAGSNTALTFAGDTDHFHTRLVEPVSHYADNASSLEVVRLADKKRAVYVQESHVTVIKKSPTQPLELEMLRSSTVRVNSSGNETAVTGSFSYAFDEEVSPSPISVTFNQPVDFRVGNVLLIKADTSDTSTSVFEDYQIRAQVVTSSVVDSDNLFAGGFELKILSQSETVSTGGGDVVYIARLADSDALFEFKLPRFSYRYKYIDGEYSTFAPWSRIAFLSDIYEYEPKKGYNHGMVNQLRSLKLKNYHPNEGIIPSDVLEIDILYKESNNPTVYTVRTLKPSDGDPIWPNLALDPRARGEYALTTDMVHAVVPSNQLLRPWDNVPRKALAQEISANRLVYGNYLQNYTVVEDPIINITNKIESVPSSLSASPSVKSDRTYQMGVVFSDGYGRETPVITHENSSIRIPKNACGSWNRLQCSLSKTYNTPTWAQYYSYYIKETSVEYYTMAMDRWYDAFDGNIWISFPSSDRNKVDDETFLILKKKHGSDAVVTEKARYKILAIENEAPDYIKAIPKSLGTAAGGGDGGYTVGTNGGSGWPYKNNLFFTINLTTFTSSFGGDVASMADKEGLTVRFWGFSHMSEEYPIASITADENDVTITLENALGNDVNFTAPGGLPSNRIQDLLVELIEHPVENRPEFDGRFFVKIFKDAALSSNILQYSSAETSNAVTSSYDCGYLNNNALGGNGVSSPDANGLGGGASDCTHEANAATAGVVSPNVLTWTSKIDVGAKSNNTSNYANHPTEHGYHRDNPSQGESTYVWNNEYITASRINEFPLHLNADAHEFWDDVGNKDMFFIDSASEYSTTGHFGGTSQYYFSTLVFPNGSGPNDAGTAWRNGMDGRWGDQGGSYVYQAIEWHDDDILSKLMFNSHAQGGFNLSFNPHNWYRRGQYPDCECYTTDYMTGLSSVYTVGFAWPAWQRLTQAQDSGVANSQTFGNMKKAMGQSAGGIRPNPLVENESIMEISWSGMGAGWRDELTGGGRTMKNDNLKFGEIHQQLGLVPEGGNNGSTDGDSANYDDNINYGAAWDFIQKLTSTGTKFTFSTDPDQIVYTVTSSVVPNGYGAAGSLGTYATDEGINTLGYGYGDMWKDGSNRQTGIWGIRNFGEMSGEGANVHGLWRGSCIRQRWRIPVTPEIGSQGSGYNPISGTRPGDVAGGPVYLAEEYRRALPHDLSDTMTINIIEPFFGSSGSSGSGAGDFTTNPAIWETEPKESVDLDIYYQASGLIPLELNSKTNEEYIPVGSTFKAYGSGGGGVTETVGEWAGDSVFKTVSSISPLTPISDGDTLVFTRPSGYEVTAVVDGDVSSSGKIKIFGGANTFNTSNMLFSQTHTLNWNNCWSFGNGVESDRIRDDFNAPQVDNGVKASTILEEQVREERRKHGLIWSGIYNSNAGVNNTNQFVMAEAITKDVNPVYGSIQRLLNKDTQLIMFCEDKVLRAVTNKDALYNADGKPQLVASNAVIGDVQAYQGDFGISKNPESMVTTPYRTYFTDVNRNQVLSLSTEGVRSISSVGMKDHFATSMGANVWRALGTYDPNKTEYNLTISKKYTTSQVTPHDQTTVSFSEASNGWISFKSFYPQQGVGLNNDYFTFSNGQIYKHHDDETRNNFYGVQYTSDITMLFNDSPNSVKNFATINYEGTQAKVSKFGDVTIEYYNNDYSGSGTGELDGLTTVANENDGEYFNLLDKTGWYADNITTNLQTCKSVEFKDKEGKWFGTPAGEAREQLSNNKGDATVQGIGIASITHSDSGYAPDPVITVANYVYPAAGFTYISWDNTTQTENSNWVCNTVTYDNAVSGGTIAADQVVNLTITPVENSGFPLAAANLEIPEPESVVGNVYTIDGDSHVSTILLDGTPYPNNVDVETITFSDNGTPGDPTNTVNVAVKFKADQTWPTSDATYWIDIDDKASTPTVAQRSTCLITEYLNWETTHQSAPAVADLGSPLVASITETVVSAGSATGNPSTYINRVINKHHGTVDDLTTTEIAKITFARANDKYYLGGTQAPYISWQGLTDGFDDCYTSLIDPTYTGGLITSFVVHIYYTPPQEVLMPGFENDDIINRCGHKAIINYSLVEPETIVDQGSITKFEVSGIGTLNYNGGAGIAMVQGTSGAGYKLHLQKKESLTSDVTASTNGHYNYITGLFQTETPPLWIGEIGDTYGTGQNYHGFTIPPVIVDTRYDFTVDGGPVNGEMSTILANSGVPVVAGDSSWIQNGIATVDFEVGVDGADIFTIAPGQGVVRPIGNGVSVPFHQESYSVKGTHSAGVKRLRITLNKPPKNVVAGMYVTNPFGQTTATNAIQHLTKVVSVFSNVITIDKDITGPGLVDGETIKFMSSNGSVIPFDVTIGLASGRAISDVITDGSTVWEGLVGGMSDVEVTTSAPSDNSEHLSISTANGVLVGMKVAGDGIVGVDNVGYTYVTGITAPSPGTGRITMATKETVGVNVTLSFSQGDTLVGTTGSGMERGLKVLHTQALSSSASEGKLQGYLKFNSVNRSITFPIYLSEIFTTT